MNCLKNQTYVVDIRPKRTTSGGSSGGDNDFGPGQQGGGLGGNEFGGEDSGVGQGGDPGGIGGT